MSTLSQINTNGLTQVGLKINYNHKFYPFIEIEINYNHIKDIKWTQWFDMNLKSRMITRLRDRTKLEILIFY